MRDGASVVRARRILVQNLAVFALYFITARLGLMLGAVSGFATLIWPPTGIALVSLLLFGNSLWPAIALGAFAVNWSIGGTLPLSLAICAGNALEAVAGATLLRRAGVRPSLDRVRCIIAFFILAAGLSTLISATIGVTALQLGGKLTAGYGSTWTTWWLGDAMGDLVVAPFLLILSTGSLLPKEPKRRLEAAALLALVVLSGLLFFTDVLGTNYLSFPRVYFAFPILMVIALRLGLGGTAISILISAAIVVAATATRHGRFWTGSLSNSLLEAQIFLAMLAMSKLVLAAAISERNERQRNLEATEQRLRQSIEKLESTQAELRKAVRARDDFMSIASHELKTPLTSLKLQTQIRKRNLEKGLWLAFSQERLPKLVADDEKQIVRLTRLVDEMLDSSRVSTGRIQLAPEAFDLCVLVREVADRFSLLLQNAGTSVKLDAACSVVGFWDRYRIEQVFTNLLTNALKYGGGKPIYVGVTSEDGIARLVVADQGIGIAEQDRERIFEQFERAVSPNGVSGLGLGLYIVKQLVSAHEGRIRVESEVGRGSTFIIDLPQHETGRVDRQQVKES